MNVRLAIALTIVVALAGCGSHPGPAATGARTSAAESTAGELDDYYVAQKTGVPVSQVDPARRASLVQEFHWAQAVARAEEGKASNETLRALELQRIDTLVHAAAVDADVYSPPSDQELQAEYERFKASLPAQEFHVAHILVASESVAQVVIVDLQAGADFATLAKAKSADDSKARGGDLGWIAPGKLPAAFTDAVQSLKAGQFTSRPVQTQYGWHVIKVMEVRLRSAPPLDQVRAQLVANLQHARFEEFIRSSRADRTRELEAATH